MQTITIAIPTLGYIHYRAVLSLVEILAVSAGIKLDLFIVPRLPVHEARNLACKERNADFVFFVDDDMLLPRDALQRLLAHNRPVVGAVAFRRVEPFSPCIFTQVATPDAPKRAIYQPITHVNGQRIDRAHGLLQVAAIGMSCTLIHRSVFERLTYPYFSYGELSEDLSFCQRLGEMGIPIFADLDLSIGHLTDVVIDASHFARYYPETL